MCIRDSFSLQTASPPKIIIGASGPTTAGIALDHADGINVASPEAFQKVSDLIESRRPQDFEVSVHVRIDIDQPVESQLPAPSSQVDRWILAVPAQSTPEILARIHSAMHATYEGDAPANNTSEV